MNIVNVSKDENGTIIDYTMDNGLVLSHSETVNLVESGQLAGYSVATSETGHKSIRMNPDTSKT